MQNWELQKGFPWNLNLQKVSMWALRVISPALFKEAEKNPGALTHL